MTITHIILLLAIGYLVFTLDLKQKNLPVPVILVLIGTGLSFIPYFSQINITDDLIYSIFIPGLLFISAYRFSAQALKKHIRVIGFLSTVGIVITVVLLGAFIYYSGFIFVGMSFLGALLLAAILTPTDPVSVVSVLKHSSDNPDIANIVDGESMINDGTSIVLFTVLFSMYTNNLAFHPFDFMKSFLIVSIGGIVTGLIVGWLLSKAVRLINHRNYYVMLSIIMAYGGFHLAEHLGFSGVLATVSSGIILSWEFSHSNKEDHYREKLEAFWGVIEPSLLSLLFLFIGIVATPYLTHDYWVYVIVILIASILIRFLVVSGTFKLFSHGEDASLTKSIIISWAGIRGTMSIFLLLTISLSANNQSDILVSIGYSVVILSLIIQSIGVYPLSRLLEK